MASLEEIFQAAVDDQIIGGVVLMACDASGKFNYSKAFGNQTLDPSSPPIGLDAVFTFASCTKLMTTIAALQCVEKGLVKLDEDLSPTLKEFDDLQIVSFVGGSDVPIYTKAAKKITLRMLLTHTSGLCYDMMNPNLMRWRQSRGEASGASGMPILQRICTPLTFEPGASWEYGSGHDWAGVLISRLTNLSLQDYMQAYLWEPLGIKDMTFHLEQRPDMRARLIALAARQGIPDPVLSLGVYPRTGKLRSLAPGEILYDDPTVDEFGGQGSYGSAIDYLKILTSILKNDTKLLKQDTVEEMFKPQLSPAAKETYSGFVSMPLFKDTFASFPEGTGLDWGLGSMMVTTDLKDSRKKGTLSWSGLPNLLWTIDREDGLACFFAAQIVPFGDVQVGELQRAFEKEMYRRLRMIE